MIETILKLDQPTKAAGLTYPLAVIEKALENPPEWLVLDEPTTSAILMDRVAGRVKRLFIEDDELKAEIELLQTPMGIIIKTLLEHEIKLTYHSGGTGMVSSDKVVSDYAMTCVWVGSHAK